MQLDAHTELLVGQIAPEPMTVPWAGVFLWRQLSLLADYALGAADIPPSDEQYYATEFRGYQLELMVADLLSGGAVRQGLDAVLRDSHAVSVEDVAELLQNVPSFASPVVSAISAPAPASPAESELREAFVLAALVIRYCETQGLDAVTARPVMMRLFPRS